MVTSRRYYCSLRQAQKLQVVQNTAVFLSPYGTLHARFLVEPWIGFIFSPLNGLGTTYIWDCLSPGIPPAEHCTQHLQVSVLE